MNQDVEANDGNLMNVFPPNKKLFLLTTLLSREPYFSSNTGIDLFSLSAFTHSRMYSWSLEL